MTTGHNQYFVGRAVETLALSKEVHYTILRTHSEDDPCQRCS